MPFSTVVEARSGQREIRQEVRKARDSIHLPKTLKERIGPQHVVQVGGRNATSLDLSVLDDQDRDSIYDDRAKCLGRGDLSILSVAQHSQ